MRYPTPTLVSGSEESQPPSVAYGISRGEGDEGSEPETGLNTFNFLKARCR